VDRIERVLRAIDRFQQRHSLLGFPFAVVGSTATTRPASMPQGDAGALDLGPEQWELLRQTALAQTEERRPEQRVEVTFVPEAEDRDDQP
jgi:hypothetical protein